ncbi:M23 family metallopeptidase [Micromonospora costi]|uniref:M23 family metallopeptidase n=1 Tax=Micromonospora costi TaxID=1530042 RepID=A0A3B0A312_9ACTN|nr:M23 family metallopeptidase [Micromonospora costi]RKN54644.1 M23 family metallopeptidase [Micromonospora costi]
MQEDSAIQNEQPTDATVVRHRRPAGRVRLLVVGAVAVVGLGVAGAAIATTGGDQTPTPVSVDAQARADAAARADRSARESSTPVAPTTTPASPTPSPTSASPSPSVKPTTAKPKPKKTVKPKPAWVIPMKGATITSCFGPRWGTQHAGIDFAMPAGTPIHAAFGGTVVKAGDAGDGYGNSVFIDHGNGYLTHYAHQSRLIVSVGDKVTAGQVIGYEGATGDATGPHLHFEVHQGQMWNQIDPAPFLSARGIDVAC